MPCYIKYHGQLYINKWAKEIRFMSQLVKPYTGSSVLNSDTLSYRFS